MSAVAVIELVGREAAEALAVRLGGRVVARSGAGDTVPLRRRRALETAQEEIVFLVEDSSRLGAGWETALAAAFADPEVVLAWGPVAVDPALPARFRALGRLEYGRFGGEALPDSPPGNAFALRRTDALAVLAEGEGLVEHELARRLAGRRFAKRPGLAATYAGRDAQGARLATRFGHGRIYGAGRGGGVGGILRAALAMPVLSLRAVRAAMRAAPAATWLAELPWILAMATAWSAGELTGQLFGAGKSAESWT